jgi:ABC-2 type transport system permease protein
MQMKTFKASIVSGIFFSLVLPIGLLKILKPITSSDFSLYAISGTLTFYLFLGTMLAVSQIIGLERRDGKFSLMIASGIPKELYMLSILFSNGFGTLIFIPILILVADFLYGVSPSNVISLIISLVLSIYVGSIMGTDLAFSTRNYYTINSLSQVISFGLIFFAPVYYPVSAVPVPLRYFTYLEPTTYISQSIYHSYVGGNSIFYLMGLLIYGVVLTMLGRLLERRT